MLTTDLEIPRPLVPLARRYVTDSLSNISIGELQHKINSIRSAYDLAQEVGVSEPILEKWLGYPAEERVIDLLKAVLDQEIARARVETHLMGINVRMSTAQLEMTDEEVRHRQSMNEMEERAVVEQAHFRQGMNEIGERTADEEVRHRQSMNEIEERTADEEVRHRQGMNETEEKIGEQEAAYRERNQSLNLDQKRHLLSTRKKRRELDLEEKIQTSAIKQVRAIEQIKEMRNCPFFYGLGSVLRTIEFTYWIYDLTRNRDKHIIKFEQCVIAAAINDSVDYDEREEILKGSGCPKCEYVTRQVTKTRQVEQELLPEYYHEHRERTVLEKLKGLFIGENWSDHLMIPTGRVTRVVRTKMVSEEYTEEEKAFCCKYALGNKLVKR